MSRGGTRKAKAAQAARSRDRLRKERVSAGVRQKAEKKEKPKQGKGAAALVHLSGFAAPILLAFGLILSGVQTPVDAGTVYWLNDLVDDPNASYFSEPAGLVYAAAVFLLVAAVFVLMPIRVWRAVNRSRDVLMIDRTAVDSSFTLVAVVAGAWIFRMATGYSNPLSGVALVLLILSIYIPVFSALVALITPVIPGSGRIGGILPGFLRFNFTERYLLTDDQRLVLREFAGPSADEKSADSKRPVDTGATAAAEDPSAEND